MIAPLAAGNVKCPERLHSLFVIVMINMGGRFAEGCKIWRQTWVARNAGTVKSVPAEAAHSTICNLSEADPLQHISPCMPLRQPQGKVGGLDHNLLQMDGLDQAVMRGAAKGGKPPRWIME